MASRVAVVDYGRGNVHSVIKALLYLGARAELVGAPEMLERFDEAVVPGVGAFADAMARLDRTGMAGALRSFAASQRPLLGICLGMQVLLSTGREGGVTPGLDIIPGTVEPLPGGDRKLPHIGFNSVRWDRPSALGRGIPSETHFYFVHSYAAFCADQRDRLGSTEYGLLFAAAIERGNVLGTQFHPEKSGQAGLALLANFVAMGG
ncbi:MAG: imidazole glycerol phosphate synthase subunit HisH [Bacillota bacterium]|nr:imidazole glycerol phosphate synthase subunit HisH [Bacillota bacterium]